MSQYIPEAWLPAAPIVQAVAGGRIVTETHEQLAPAPGWAPDVVRLGGRDIPVRRYLGSLAVLLAVRIRWDEDGEGKRRSKGQALALLQGTPGPVILTASGMSTEAFTLAWREIEAMCSLDWPRGPQSYTVRISARDEEYTSGRSRGVASRWVIGDITDTAPEPMERARVAIERIGPSRIDAWVRAW